LNIFQCKRLLFEIYRGPIILPQTQERTTKRHKKTPTNETTHGTTRKHPQSAKKRENRKPTLGGTTTSTAANVSDGASKSRKTGQKKPRTAAEQTKTPSSRGEKIADENQRKP
jgi:hypothetical protein